MKRFLPALVSVAVGLALSCGPRPAHPITRKLVVLGFDGMDPGLLRKWMDEGKLPNMQKLAARGGFYTLATTRSPESPTAWASFATGVNPGKHDIYDFLVRDARTYVPEIGLVRTEPPRFLFDYLPVAAAKLTPRRAGTPFWVRAGREGVRASVLTVPMTFPPEDLPNGELLAGLPLPDIRGTMGTFSYFGTDLTRYEEGNTEFGGILRRLVFDADDATADLVGPPDPIVGQQIREIAAKAPLDEAGRQRIAGLKAREDLRLPIAIHWNHEGRSATIDIGDNSVHLQQGEWSQWIDLDFPVNLFLRLHGMAQLYLIDADKALRLYVSPINWKPDEPPSPMSSPASLSADIYERLGPFRTLGWAEATWPLNEGRIDEKAFMEDLYRAFDDRAQVILERLDAHRWDLLVGVIESTDRVQHMMWRLIDPTHPMYDQALAERFGNSIENVYRRCDDFVGDVLSRIDPSTPVLIVSDHGFHAYRQSVNLNTWLVQQGYMTLVGDAPGPRSLVDLSSGQFWDNVDWSHTKAYAMGLGQIYLNIRGREGQGIVAPGAEARALAGDIAAKLLALVDPKTGARVVDAVYKAGDVYTGPYVSDAAELQVGLADGYRVSWQTTLGGAPPGIIQPNLRRWSGDHGSSDYRSTSGILISSLPITTAQPDIMDVAPTVLKYFGLALPAELDGKALF